MLILSILATVRMLKRGDRVYTLAYEKRGIQVRGGDNIWCGQKRDGFEIKNTVFFQGTVGALCLNSTGEVIGIACAAGLTMADHGTIITFELGIRYSC